jgi:Fic family protein
MYNFWLFLYTFLEIAVMKMLPPSSPIEQIESRSVLKKLTTTHAALAELKGVAASIPNQQILIDTLALQEAKDSSEIENIVTTHDELYRSSFAERQFASPSAKEVYAYAEALKSGFHELQKTGLITIKTLLRVQEIIEMNNAGIRKLPGTVLRNELTGQTVYTPPQSGDEIVALLRNLERFINENDNYSADPLIKMAIIHHQFESIHPFYDGNGRTGRILNLLYLIQQGLLKIPILYISKYIITHRPQYYALLQSTREDENWEPWILYMLDAVEQTSVSTIASIQGMKQLMMDFKHKIRSAEPKIYSQDLINNLFRHPYTKIISVQKDLQVSRLTALKYLNRLVELELLKKTKIGRTNYYINEALMRLLMNPGKTDSLL